MYSKNPRNFEEAFAEARREENNVLMSKQQEQKLENGGSDRISRGDCKTGASNEKSDGVHRRRLLFKEGTSRKGEKKRRTPVERGLREDQKKINSPFRINNISNIDRHRQLPLVGIILKGFKDALVDLGAIAYSREQYIRVVAGKEGQAQKGGNVRLARHTVIENIELEEEGFYVESALLSRFLQSKRRTISEANKSHNLEVIIQEKQKNFERRTRKSTRNHKYQSVSAVISV